MGKWISIFLAACVVVACGGEPDSSNGRGNTGGSGGTGLDAAGGAGGDASGGTGGTTGTGGDDGTGGSGGTIGAGGAGGSGGSSHSIPRDERCQSMRFEACGGDLTGTWTVDYSCGTSFDLMDHFPDVWPSPSGCRFLDMDVQVEADGSITYEGGLEIGDVDYRGTFRFDVPKNCLEGLRGEQTVAELCATIGRKVAPGHENPCVLRDDQCACDYEKQGTIRGQRALEEVFEGAFDYAGTDAGFSYCVDGDSVVQSRDDFYLYLVREPS